MLPTTGSLSIKDAAGNNRSIAYEEDKNLTGDKSLLTLGKSAFGSAEEPHSMLEFYGYNNIYLFVEDSRDNKIGRITISTQIPSFVYLTTSSDWTSSLNDPNNIVCGYSPNTGTTGNDIEIGIAANYFVVGTAYINFENDDRLEFQLEVNKTQ